MKMKTVVDLACSPCSPGIGQVGSRGAHQPNHARVKLQLLGVRPGDGVGLAAAPLDGLGRFRRRGLWLLLHAVRAVTALTRLGRGIVRARYRQRYETAPPLRESQEESVAEDQTSDKHAHTLFYAESSQKVPRQHRNIGNLLWTTKPQQK
jgi:hypothetical protein